MSANKIVIIVLVAIAMLFVVGLALGSNKHDSSAGPNRNGFLSHFQAGKFLQVSGDVTATGCASTTPSLVVVGTVPCVLSVPKGGLLARPTRIALRPTSGPVVVTVAPNGKGPDLEQAVNGGDCLGGALDGKGGTVALRSPGIGPGPSVQLLTQRCP